MAAAASAAVNAALGGFSVEYKSTETKQATTTKKPTVVSPTAVVVSANDIASALNESSKEAQKASIHKIQKHPDNKTIIVVDPLHKFDLFIDPICEQLGKLKDRQVEKSLSQLKHFSSQVGC